MRRDSTWVSIVAEDSSNSVAPGRGLEAIFSPRSVAVVGATDRERSVGRTIFWNLLRDPFGGTVYPINPKRDSVLGVRAYPNVSSLPGPIDLAVITTPALTVPDIVRECASCHVRGIIIISAGFKETGPAGVALEQEVLDIARKANIRIIGPNCLGVMNPLVGFNATFASSMARRGTVGFISQSGALCTAVLDWSLRENVGFSAFVSLGSMLDVGWGDLIDYLGDDPQTQSIVIYMETVGDARTFMSAAREVALTKPIIVIKPGRTSAGARAAASHTGSLAGSDTVLDAAFQRCGVLRVDTIADLFNMAEVLGKQPRPNGRRLAIVTNAGGPGVLATDALITGGGQLAELSAETLGELNAFLPAHWSHNNPVDILGDAEPERYARAVELVRADPQTDGVLVVLTPQAMTDPTQTAELLKSVAVDKQKPFLASWMGGAEVSAGEAILNHANIPTFSYPDAAAAVFNYMWRYGDVLKANYETPLAFPDDREPTRAAVADIIQQARDSSRSILTESESKAILNAYGIPVVGVRLARSAEAAVEAAEALGYPVVVKLHSETVTHKTDVGGVRLDLRSAAAVRQAYQDVERSVREGPGAGHFQGVAVQPMIRWEGYELIAGCSFDPQFGPVLLFGAGGTLVEVLRDRAVELPPLNRALARRLMQRTRIWRALLGARGKPPVDTEALEAVLIQLSQLITEQQQIREIDINPLLAAAHGIAALDARIVLHPRDMAAAELPRPAIRPYPRQYVWRDLKLGDGLTFTIRPIRPEDEPTLVRFHERLSERTVLQRYERQLRLADRVAHDRLIRVCFADYDRQILLIAEARDAPQAERTIIGAARLTRLPNDPHAQFRLVVADEFQGRGLGKELVGRLIEVARAEGLRSLSAIIKRDNEQIEKLCRVFGFEVKQHGSQEHIEAVLEL